MGADRGSTVLVVEDERLLADTYARWLDDDYEVRTAYTGQSALELLDEEVDVVLLDRRLPDLAGGQVLQRLREEGYTCRVAMLTAVDPDFDILEMPLDDYAVKPVLRDQLEALVDRLFRLATFDERARESYALAAKIALLESEKSREALEDNEEYRRSRDALRDVDEDVRETLAAFDAGDYADAYRALDVRPLRARDGGDATNGDDTNE